MRMRISLNPISPVTKQMLFTPLNKFYPILPEANCAMSDPPASSPCSAASADDAYMGYAGRDELLAALNELLEAERAGAKVALHSRNAIPGERYATTIRQVRDDEARWCAMLSAEIRRLGGTPSEATGAFLAKAMAIADPRERMAFLIRGQGWVVRKLEALRPRVRDDQLHAALGEMLDNHRQNIDLVGRLLPSAP